jgi:iron(III) transport system substrate-binding protein
MLILVSPALGFEIEEERLFVGRNASAGLSVLSTTDADIAAPLIAAFLTTRPDLSVRYVMASSRDIYAANATDRAAFDLVISSAMDLQMKLANDGFAQPHESAAALPDWARWRDLVFGFAPEPIVTVVSLRGFDGLAVPQIRRDLIALLRENPERFKGRIGTYDPHISGAGYLFAAEDARQTDAFWRLAKVAGRLDARLYCCSVDMIDDLAAGEIFIAYNVVGSYAATHAARLPEAGVIELQDFTSALSAIGPGGNGARSQPMRCTLGVLEWDSRFMQMLGPVGLALRQCLRAKCAGRAGRSGSRQCRWLPATARPAPG